MCAAAARAGVTPPPNPREMIMDEENIYAIIGEEGFARLVG